MHKFTFEALVPLIGELVSYISEKEIDSDVFYDLRDILKPYKALVEERKNQIESLQDGSLSWSAG